MASGSAPHREAGMPATHLDFRDAEAIPDEAFAFLLGLARLQIEPPDLTRWYTRLYDNVRVDNVPDPESGPQAGDATAQHQIKHTHEQYLHHTEIPETADMPVPVATQHVTEKLASDMPRAIGSGTHVRVRAAREFGLGSITSANMRGPTRAMVAVIYNALMLTMR
nr:hypothetical protein B0A51_16280 [Rachicladosporium sp. CCFEE 5018]